MMPIHELLNRIRWDEAFADAEFIIGFYDRVADLVVRRPLKEVYFEKDDHYFFYFMDDEGETHNVPLHRIREIVRDGELIWQRD
jgi:uncharacterized protein (UPF0248 family)